LDTHHPLDRPKVRARCQLGYEMHHDAPGTSKMWAPTSIQMDTQATRMLRLAKAIPDRPNSRRNEWPKAKGVKATRDSQHAQSVMSHTKMVASA
jgi:hypothetical protein